MRQPLIYTLLINGPTRRAFRVGIVLLFRQVSLLQQVGGRRFKLLPANLRRRPSKNPLIVDEPRGHFFSTAFENLMTRAVN